jgi:hypothetical protein
MKSIALLSLALIAAGAVHAQGADFQLQNAPHAAGGLTRAEVKAELARARAAGEIQDGEGWAMGNRPAPPGTMTRAEVRAELLRAQAAGEIQDGEATYVGMEQAGAPRDRAAVRAEAIEAARSRRQDLA